MRHLLIDSLDEPAGLASRVEPWDVEDVTFWTGGHADAVVVLSTLSQLTSRALLGVRLSQLDGRPPLMAAKQVVTLDLLSAGRVVVAHDDEALSERFDDEVTRCDPPPTAERLRTCEWPVKDLSEA